MSDQLSDFLKRRYAAIEHEEAVAAVAPLIARLERMYDQFKDYADPNFLSEFCGGNEQKLVQRYWEMYLGCRLLDQGRSLKPASERPNNKGPDIQIVEDGYKVWIEAYAPELGDKNNRPDEDYLRALSGEHEIPLRNVPHSKFLLRYTNAIAIKREKFEEFRAAKLIAKQDVCVIAINAGLLGADGFDGLSQYPYAVEAVYSFRNQELVLSETTAEIVETRLAFSRTVKKSDETEIGIGVFVDGSCKNISAIIAASRQPHQEIIQGARELITVHNPNVENKLAKEYVEGAVDYWLEVTNSGKHKVRSNGDDNKISSLRNELIEAASVAGDLSALEAIRVGALGKKGTITEQMKGLGKLDGEARKAAGQALNALKNEVAGAIEARKAELEDAELDKRLATESIDISLPVRPEAQGRIHPISQATDEVVSIFGEMGFSVAEGPDIENDWYNFTALNIPPEHPARQMHDTFYLAGSDEGAGRDDRDQPGVLLRTHTSPVQIRTMQSVEPPIRILVPGRTYRCDSDMTHTPMFHQFEGLVIDRKTHMGHLKGCLIEFCRAYFEVEDVPVRFRPSHFPFTEPSAEVDIGCTHTRDGIKIGTGDDWLEILGCGMVHPKVLANCGIDPEIYQGFAFGMGTERIAMLKYGIPDLRTFFEADLRWLRHYGFVPLDVPSLTGGLGG